MRASMRASMRAGALVSLSPMLALFLATPALATEKNAKKAPTPLTTIMRDFQRAMTGQRQATQQCLSQHRDPGFYQIRVTVKPSGKMQNVQPLRAPTRSERPELYAAVPADVDGGKVPSSPTNRCLAKVIAGLSIPPFEGNAQTLVYPLVLH